MNWTPQNSDTLMIVAGILGAGAIVFGAVAGYNMHESDNRIEMKALDNERLGFCMDIELEAERLLCMNGVFGRD